MSRTASLRLMAFRVTVTLCVAFAMILAAPSAALAHNVEGQVKRFCVDTGRYWDCSENKKNVHHHANGKHYVHDWYRNCTYLKNKNGSRSFFGDCTRWTMRSHTWAGY